jgi:hypothetical protein
MNIILLWHKRKCATFAVTVTPFIRPIPWLRSNWWVSLGQRLFVHTASRQALVRRENSSDVVAGVRHVGFLAMRSGRSRAHGSLPPATLATPGSR